MISSLRGGHPSHPSINTDDPLAKRASLDHRRFGISGESRLVGSLADLITITRHHAHSKPAFDYPVDSGRRMPITAAGFDALMVAARLSKAGRPRFIVAVDELETMFRSARPREAGRLFCLVSVFTPEIRADGLPFAPIKGSSGAILYTEATELDELLAARLRLMTYEAWTFGIATDVLDASTRWWRSVDADMSLAVRNLERVKIAFMVYPENYQAIAISRPTESWNQAVNRFLQATRELR